MVAIVGQIEQGKFFVVDVVLADKCLYFCGNDVMWKELFDAGEKGNTYRNEIIEEDEGMDPKHMEGGRTFEKNPDSQHFNRRERQKI